MTHSMLKVPKPTCRLVLNQMVGADEAVKQIELMDGQITIRYDTTQWTFHNDTNIFQLGNTQFVIKIDEEYIVHDKQFNLEIIGDNCIFLFNPENIPYLLRLSVLYDAGYNLVFVYLCIWLGCYSIDRLEKALIQSQRKNEQLTKQLCDITRILTNGSRKNVTQDVLKQSIQEALTKLDCLQQSGKKLNPE